MIVPNRVFFLFTVDDNRPRLHSAIARHHDRSVTEAFRRSNSFGEIDP
jgi:hypothetical protein